MRDSKRERQRAQEGETLRLREKERLLDVRRRDCEERERG